MPWESEWVPAPLFLSYKGVNVYHTYKMDELSAGDSNCCFVLNSNHGEDKSFFVPQLSTWPVDGDTRQTEENVRAAIIAAIDKGELVADPDDPGPEEKSTPKTQTMSKEQELTMKLMKDPDHCPNCGSSDISAYDYNGGEILSHSTRCTDCGTVWIEEYKRFNVCGLELPEQEQPRTELDVVVDIVQFLGPDWQDQQIIIDAVKFIEEKTGKPFEYEQKLGI